MASLASSLKRVLVGMVLVGMLPGCSQAQTETAQYGESGGAPVLPADKLDELVGPIALYPDVLLAQILPASTFPLDIVKAARWMRPSPDVSKVTDQPWDPSVQALCHYPSVLEKLDADLDWTNALGVAFLTQQADVMESIQRLRRRAEAAGALKTTVQQQVVYEQATIRIVPAQQDVVYVPVYDPQVVYVYDDDDDDVSAVAAAAVGFGAGLALGSWLDTDCDWHHGHVHYCRPGYWGGWGYAGVVRYDDDWVAGRGPRRGFVAGDDRGAYVGPRGAAVWGDNGRAAVWRRPPVYGTPRYTGRYASYNQRYGGTYGRSSSSRRDHGRSSAMRSGSSGGSRSSFGDSRGSRQVSRHSSRGRSSRGSSFGGRGGGGRRGGGRRR